MEEKLTMPVKRPEGPLSCSVCFSTLWMGSSLPHCSTVFAKSSGIVMLAAVAPARHKAPRSQSMSLKGHCKEAFLCGLSTVHYSSRLQQLRPCKKHCTASWTTRHDV